MARRILNVAFRGVKLFSRSSEERRMRRQYSAVTLLSLLTAFFYKYLEFRVTGGVVLAVNGPVLERRCLQSTLKEAMLLASVKGAVGFLDARHLRCKVSFPVADQPSWNVCRRAVTRAV